MIAIFVLLYFFLFNIQSKEGKNAFNGITFINSINKHVLLYYKHSYFLNRPIFFTHVQMPPGIILTNLPEFNYTNKSIK